VLPRFFIDRPVFAWVIALVIVLAGILALRKLPVAQYPQVAPPAIASQYHLPGRQRAGGRGHRHRADRAGDERHRAPALHGGSASELGTGR
jgi:hypothetical protein